LWRPDFVDNIVYFRAKLFQLEQGKENLRVQQWVVMVAIVLFVLKILAYFLTRSVAVLTDALESTVNVIAGIIGWYSLYVSAKPRDADHPYGHGKAEFLSAAIEGTLIIIAGLIIIFEAVYNLFTKPKLEKLDYGILIVAVSGLINYGMGFIAMRKGKQNKSLALEASGRHLQSDTYSTFAVVVGLILIYFTKIQQIDSIIAIIISFIITIVGYRITRKSIAGIMDEADQKILSELVDLLNHNRRPNWIDIHNLRVIKFGSVLHVDCHLTVPWYLNVKESHDETEKLMSLITNQFGESMEFFVHVDGCKNFSCPICTISDCKVRQHPFQKKIAWTPDNIISDKNHLLLKD
jgi:cation diffusion facilitator family transporter